MIISIPPYPTSHLDHPKHLVQVPQCSKADQEQPTSKPKTSTTLINNKTNTNTIEVEVTDLINIYFI